MRKQVQLRFGVFADTLSNQLRKAGIRGWTVKQARRWQHAADAITTCSLHRVITPVQTVKARQRLLKQIGQDLPL